MTVAASRARSALVGGAVVGMVVGVVAGAWLPVAPWALADSQYSFTASGLDGGGFQNVVAYSPFGDADGARPLLLGPTSPASIAVSTTGRRGRPPTPGSATLGKPGATAHHPGGHGPLRR